MKLLNTLIASAVIALMVTGPALAQSSTSMATTNSYLGPTSASACTTDTATCSLNALLKRLLQSQTTQSGYQDGVEGLLTTIDASLNDIETAAEDTTTATPIKPQAQTTGGCTPGVYRSAASNNSTLISTGAHTLCSLTIVNTTATIYYVRLYDQSAAPTCSSGTGEVASLPIPAATTGAGIASPLGPFGIAVTSGLGFCITASGAATSNDSAATGVTVNYSYK